MAKKVTVKSKRASKSPHSYGKLVTKAPRNSGKTTFEISMAKGQGTIKPKKVGIEPKAGGALLQTGFVRVRPDASPGWNTIVLTGLPLGTKFMSVWMTEFDPGNNFSTAGNAFFDTHSVQLFDRGRQCRVRYFLNFDIRVPAGAMFIFGPV
jgi:hypothetical protein